MKSIIVLSYLKITNLCVTSMLQTSKYDYSRNLKDCHSIFFLGSIKPIMKSQSNTCSDQSRSQAN